MKVIWEQRGQGEFGEREERQICFFSLSSLTCLFVFINSPNNSIHDSLNTGDDDDDEDGDDEPAVSTDALSVDEQTADIERYNYN